MKVKSSKNSTLVYPEVLLKEQIEKRVLSSKNNNHNTLANFFIILGILCLLTFSYLIFERSNPERLSFDDFKEDKEISSINTSQTPEEILIPDVNINLPILPSKIDNGKWSATTKGVSYLTTSPLPGEKGNSILYGHNFPNLLGNLNKIKPGQKIVIKYTDGNVKEFVVKFTLEVSPKQTNILETTDDNRITLYTCSGFLDSKRFVVIANFQS